MDFLEKSFASSGETSKLLITLSTALIAFCATVVNVKFGDETLFTPTTIGQKMVLAASWVFMLISTAVGVWTQLAITDVLSKGSAQNPPSAWNRKITFPYRLQIVAFLMGVMLLTLYGVSRLFD